MIHNYLDIERFGASFICFGVEAKLKSAMVICVEFNGTMANDVINEEEVDVVVVVLVESGGGTLVKSMRCRVSLAQLEKKAKTRIKLCKYKKRL